MALKIGDIETGFGVRTQDADISPEEYRELVKTPIYFILDNLRSAFNVGAIFRLADVLRVSRIFLCGYTAYPPHIKLEKTSLGTIDYVPWTHCNTTEEAVLLLQEQGIPVWAAETATDAVRYDTIALPSAVGIVLGNEALGVSPSVLSLCDALVEIPVFGFKNSMNVATACAVLGFSLAERMGIFDQGDMRSE